MNICILGKFTIVLEFSILFSESWPRYVTEIKKKMIQSIEILHKVVMEFFVYDQNRFLFFD